MLGPIAGWVFGSEGSWSEGFQVIPRSARRAFGHGPLEGRQHHVVDMMECAASSIFRKLSDPRMATLSEC